MQQEIYRVIHFNSYNFEVGGEGDGHDTHSPPTCLSGSILDLKKSLHIPKTVLGE